MTNPLRLGVNIDHVATVRNARGGTNPDPVRAAHLAIQAGADGITAHLREDRRHILDGDIARLKAEISKPLNFEIAATDEMQKIAVATKPHAVCIVPEKREERTTEGGLDAIGGYKQLSNFIPPLLDAGIRVSLFVEASPAQLDAAKSLGAQIVELHTGRYCDEVAGAREAELMRIKAAAEYAAKISLECHAGHGLAFDTVGPVAAIGHIVELNIGHFLIGEAIYLGLEAAVGRMRVVMDKARSGTVTV